MVALPPDEHRQRGVEAGQRRTPTRNRKSTACRGHATGRRRRQGATVAASTVVRGRDLMDSVHLWIVLVDAGRPATLPSFHQGRAPRNKSRAIHRTRRPWSRSSRSWPRHEDGQGDAAGASRRPSSALLGCGHSLGAADSNQTGCTAPTQAAPASLTGAGALDLPAGPIRASAEDSTAPRSRC